MARLPNIGGDNGSWGQILNDFLSVEHNADGTLKKASDIAAKYTKPSGGIPAGDLSSATQTSLTKADSAVQSVNAKFPSSGNVTLTAADVGAIPATQKGAANGVAELGAGSLVPTGQLGSGTASSGTFLAGDGTWKTSSSGIVTNSVVSVSEWTQTTAPGSPTPATLPWLPNVSGAIRRKPARRLVTTFAATDVTQTGVGGAGNPPALVEDTTDPLLGTKDVRFTTSSGAGANGTIAWPALTTAIDVTNTNIRVPIKISSTTSAAYFEVRFYSDGTGASGNYHKFDLVFTTESTFVPDNIWSVVGAPIAQFTAVGSGATLTAVNFVKIIFGHAGTVWSGSVPPYIDAEPYGSAKAKCTFIAADGYTSAWTLLAPKLAKYGWAGVIGPNALNVGNTASDKITAQQLRYLTQYWGWEVQAHALSDTDHNQSTHTDAELLANATAVKAWGAANGYAIKDGSLYADYKNHTASQRLMSEKLWRTFRLSTLRERVAESLPVTDPMRVRTFLLGTGDTHAARFKPYVDKAIASKGWCTFVMHNALTDTALAAEFDLLLAYLDANRASIDVVTTSGALESCTL